MSSRILQRIIKSLTIKVNGAGTTEMPAALRAIAWLILLAIIALTLVPPLLRPASGLPHDVEHFAAFLLLGGAFALAYPGRPFWLGAFAILFAAGLEVFQIFAPGRHARIRDFVVDAAAACIGIAVAALRERVHWLSRRTP